MHQEQENPYPNGSAVFARYPADPPGPNGYGSSETWPWMPAEVVQRCGDDEWEVKIIDRRFAMLADGSEPTKDTPSSELFYPKVFRNGDELMVDSDHSTTPDGPPTTTPDQEISNQPSAALCAYQGVLADRVVQAQTTLQMWSGAGMWKGLPDAARVDAGVSALANLVNTTADLLHLCCRLYRSGCASNNINYDMLFAALQMLLVAAGRAGEDTEMLRPTYARPGAAEVGPGPAGAAAGAPAAAAAPAAAEAQDQQWVFVADDPMDYEDPTQLVDDEGPST